jgi:ABC-type enterochelin transport system permease subunit
MKDKQLEKNKEFYAAWLVGMVTFAIMMFAIMTRDNELDVPTLVVGGIVIGLVGPLLAFYPKKNPG